MILTRKQFDTVKNFSVALKNFENQAKNLLDKWESAQDEIPEFERMIATRSYPIERSFDEFCEQLETYVSKVNTLLSLCEESNE